MRLCKLISINSGKCHPSSFFTAHMIDFGIPSSTSMTLFLGMVLPWLETAPAQVLSQHKHYEKWLHVSNTFCVFQTVYACCEHPPDMPQVTTRDFFMDLGQTDEHFTRSNLSDSTILLRKMEIRISNSNSACGINIPLCRYRGGRKLESLLLQVSALGIEFKPSV